MLLVSSLDITAAKGADVKQLAHVAAMLLRDGYVGRQIRLRV
ncbi:hypothetical protein [Pseudomonas sp. NPDC087615]